LITTGINLKQPLTITSGSLLGFFGHSSALDWVSRLQGEVMSRPLHPVDLRQPADKNQLPSLMCGLEVLLVATAGGEWLCAYISSAFIRSANSVQPKHRPSRLALVICLRHANT